MAVRCNVEFANLKTFNVEAQNVEKCYEIFGKRDSLPQAIGQGEHSSRQSDSVRLG